MPIIVTTTETPVAASTIIKRAMRMVGQIGAGEEPTSSEYADCLVALNDLIDSWRNDKLMTYALRTESLTLVAGTSSYGIGSGSDLDTNRPVEIVNAYISSGGTDYGVDILTEDEWAAIPDKTATANWPDRILPRPSMSNATILTYPVPSEASTLKLVTRVPLEAFESSSDTIALAPGYARALASNLAIEIAPEFEKEVPAAVVRIATDSLRWIRTVNRLTRPSHLTTELGAMFNAPRSRILSDQP